MNQSKPIQNRSARKGPKSSKPKAQKRVPKSLLQSSKVSAPSAQGRVQRTNRPKTTGMPNGDIVIEHREYVADVLGSIAFSNTQYPLNPGLASSFPWLSTIARSYESYVFEKLSARFETQAPSTTAGTLMLAVDYDASDPAPVSKAQAMAYRSSVRSPAWAASEHHSEAEDLRKRQSFFVRSGALSANQDVKLYDTGNLNVGSQGETGAGAIGELYFDYRVRLMTPQIGNLGVGESVGGMFTGSSNAAPFATATGNLPAAVVSTGTTTSVNTWTFTQAWEGYVTVWGVGTAIVSMAESGTATYVELQQATTAADAERMQVGTLSALPGQTYIVTIGNTAVTTGRATFGQADS